MEVLSIIQVLTDFTESSRLPENFVSSQQHLESPFTDCTKRLFDFNNDCSKNKHRPSTNDLTELITEGLDGEQIWEEIELTNEPLLKRMVCDVAKILTSQDRVTLLRNCLQNHAEDVGNCESDQEKIQKNDGSQDLCSESQESESSHSDFSDQDSETNFDFDLETRAKKKQSGSSSGKPRGKETQGRTSIVDDDFFRLSEMEKFLEMEDAKEERRRRQEEAGGDGKELGEAENSDEESIDLFDDFPSDEESDDEETQDKGARDMKYRDYFGDDNQQLPSKRKSVKFQDLDSENDEDADVNTTGKREGNSDDSDQSDDDFEEEVDESEGEEVDEVLGGKINANKSTFEKRQEKLKEKIAQLEEANLAQKPWQLSGESSSTKRPENSLLEKDLDFEVATKPAPVITEETTQALEDIIQQRILDRSWDDVERKERHLEEPYEFKKRVTLDQEKSKLSLAEIYEKEYLKQTQQEKEKEENPAHVDIKKTMDALFVKLDALSNFHYMPKPVIPEVKIVKNVPSIAMEEVAPITVSDAALLAPEEIQEKSKGELKGDSEKTGTDKKQALRQKKKHQSARARDKLQKQRTVEKLKPGMGNKYSMKGALQRLEQDSKLPSGKTTIVKGDKKEKALKSSKSFFGRLQDEVTSEIRGLKTKKRPQTQTLSSKRLKL